MNMGGEMRTRTAWTLGIAFVFGGTSLGTPAALMPISADLCGLCFATGATIEVTPTIPSVSFVAGTFGLGAGACEWQEEPLECVPIPLDGCYYVVSGHCVRGTPPWEESVPVTAIAKPNCGDSGMGSDQSIAGTLKVSVTCTDCVEGP